MGSVVGWGKVLKMYGALLTKEGLKMTTQGNFNGFIGWINWIYMLGLGKAITTRTFVVNQKDPGWVSLIFGSLLSQFGSYRWSLNNFS